MPLLGVVGVGVGVGTEEGEGGGEKNKDKKYSLLIWDDFGNKQYGFKALVWA